MINFYDSFYSQNILRRLINDYTVNSDTENPCIDCLLCCYDTLRFIYLFRLCIYENIRCGRIWENNYKWQFVKYIAVATMINFLYDTLKFFSVVTIRALLFRRCIFIYIYIGTLYFLEEIQAIINLWIERSRL